MSAKFTPGPWVCGPEAESAGKLVYIPIRCAGRKASTMLARQGKGESIATAGVYGKNPDGSTAGAKYTDRCGDARHKPVITADECRGNARLIAAAPELIERLKNAVGRCLCLRNADELCDHCRGDIDFINRVENAP